MIKETLEKFEEKILETIIKKTEEGEFSEITKILANFYKENPSFYNLNGFMNSFIYSIGKKEIDTFTDNFPSAFTIELFLDKNFKTNDEDLNYYRNFVQIEEYSFFTFILKNKTTNIGTLGILYYNGKINEFNIKFLKKENNSGFFLRVKEDVNLLNGDKAELLFALKKFLYNKELSEKILKKELIEEFDEFFSLVLNLNEEQKKLIEPFGQRILEKLNRIEIKD